MNKIIYLLIGAMMAVGLTACDGKDKPKEFDTGASLYINVRNNARAMNFETRALDPIPGDPQEVLTPRQIVEQSFNFMFDDEEGYKGVYFAITESEMKDIANERIVMRGDMIIDRHGKIVTAFLTAKNLRIINGQGQAIAYIPQTTLKTAWEEIQKAYNAGDYDKVYQLFQTAYTAIPCTQLQWEALKEKGEN